MAILSPRILIIVRAGRHSIHTSWVWTVSGLADVAVSSYDDVDFSEAGIKYLHYFPGGKFPGLASFFETFPAVIEEYDYFWLFEDDLVLPLDSLIQTITILSNFAFDLAAPALTFYSFFTWPIAMRNNKFLFRCTNFVEVMAPIMSRAFLRKAFPAFNENYSGWGHEWLWQKLLTESESFAAILDSAPITHSRPFGSGSLYRNSPAYGWTPEEDKKRILEKYGLDQNVKFSNFFGVSRGQPHRVLAEDEFFDEALTGYAEMDILSNNAQKRCVDNLRGEARPRTPLSSLREFGGFRMVEEALKLPDSTYHSPILPGS